jgi:ectoine hydroxylase-related dioxygenase (phytanoyl-CoA dioxygenase family)
MTPLKIFDFKNKPTENEIVNFIKSDGVVVIQNFCSYNDLEKLKDEYQSILSGSHQNSDWFENREYSLGVAALLTKKDVMKDQYPALFDFFSQPIMQSITDAYLGNGFHSNQKIFVVKDVVGNSHNANDLHFDVQRTLKFFLYLNDANESNGAFRCVPGSHNETKKIRAKNSDKISYENREFSRMLPFGPEDTVSVEGKAGSLIIFDTDVFHQAGKVSEGERWVMRGQTEPVPGTVPKSNDVKPTFFQKLKSKFF